VNDPHCALPHVTVQFTPPLPGSFETLAAMLNEPPALSLLGADCVNEMPIGLVTVAGAK
jgi:hypothetical protein